MSNSEDVVQQDRRRALPVRRMLDQLDALVVPADRLV
jgi:hypothetical protein